MNCVDVIPWGRPVDAPAPRDHVHALPRRLVVDVDVEGALIRLRADAVAARRGG